MLILFYNFFVTSVLPELVVITAFLFEQAMVYAVMFAGIVLLFGSLGFHISQNMGTSVVNGIFRAVGYIVHLIVRVIRYVVVGIIGLLPRIYKATNRSLQELEMKQWQRSIISFLVTMIAMVIII